MGITKTAKAIWFAPLNLLAAGMVFLAGCTTHIPIELNPNVYEGEMGFVGDDLKIGDEIDVTLTDGSKVEGLFVYASADTLYMDFHEFDPKRGTIRSRHKFGVDTIDVITRADKTLPGHIASGLGFVTGTAITFAAAVLIFWAIALHDSGPLM